MKNPDMMRQVQQQMAAMDPEVRLVLRRPSSRFSRVFSRVWACCNQSPTLTSALFRSGR